MKTEVLQYSLKNLFRLTSIPNCLYKDGKAVKAYHHDKYWFDMPYYLENILNDESDYNFTLTPQALAFATVRCGKYLCLIGPTKTLPINSKMLRDILIDNNIKLENADALKRYIDILPTMTPEYFSIIVASCYVNLNHEIVTATQILEKLDIIVSEIQLSEMIKKRQSQIVLGNKLPHNTYEYERKLLYCVKNGLIEEIHKLGGLGEDSVIEPTNSNPLIHFKNLLMTQKTLVSRAAIEGGVDPETAYSLSDAFAYKIENCKTYHDLNDVSYAINDTFCKLVKDIKYPKSDNLIVNKAVSYINDHLTETLTATDIAKSLNISREYISSMFKKAIGQSIPEFITEKKIAVAKKLLRFTDNSLIEISNYLSFSSQSYFQVQFKKITGMTPTEYRNGTN